MLEWLECFVSIELSLLVMILHQRELFICWGCLQALAADYRKAGSQLLFVDGDPVDRIPQLASTLKAKAVYWHHDVEAYAQTRDDRVTTALQSQDIQTHTNWDRLLHDPTTIRTGNKQPYSVYTPFWRNWNSQPKPAPVAVKLPPSELTPAEKQVLTQLPTINLPTAAELGFTWEEPLIFRARYQSSATAARNILPQINL